MNFFKMIIFALWHQTSSKFTWDELEHQPKYLEMVNFISMRIHSKDSATVASA